MRSNKLPHTEEKAAPFYTLGKKSVITYPEKIHNALRDKTKISIGNNTFLRCEIQVLGHGGEVTIGDDCYVGENSYIWSGKKICIGNRVLIGHNCNIFDNDIHPIDDYYARHLQYLHILTKGQPKNIQLNDEEVIIEDDVWIGANVTILKGVSIGKCAVIGVNSVVTKDVEAYSVNAGNPSKKIRNLNENT